MCLVLCHKKPHIEELTELYVIRELEGEYNLTIQYKFINESELPGMLKQFPNAIVLGMGDSEFDEHPRNGKKKEAESSIELFAKKFGVLIETREFGGIMHYAKINDTKGSTILLELGNIVKEFFKNSEVDKVTVNWFFDYMDKDLQILRSYTEDELKSLYLTSENSLRISAREYDAQFRADVKREHKNRYDSIVIPTLHSFNTLVAVRIAKAYGKDLGISKNTKIKFIDTKNYRVRKGELAIGFGNGEFSTFPAEKMLQVCNIKHDFYNKFYVLMEYLRSVNLRNGYHQYEFASMYIRRQLQTNENLFLGLWDTYKWGSRIIDLYIKKQQHFIAAKNELGKLLKEKKAYFAKVNGMKVLTVHSYNEVEMVNTAFAKNGFQCDVVIAKNLRGNMVILFKDEAKRRFNVPGIVKSIRKAEMLKRGISIQDDRYWLLYSEGILDEVPWWFYDKKTGGIFNGSRTRTDIEPTVISVNKVLGILKLNKK